jgi:hypothetical protein
MALNNPRAHYNDANSYLVGAIPFTTSSLVVPASTGDPLAVSFPLVTQFVTVRCDDPTNAVRVGFSANGVKATEQNNYFTLTSSGSYTGEFRVARIYLLSDTTSASTATVIAGLTPAAAGQVASGIINNWSGSSGVG